MRLEAAVGPRRELSPGSGVAHPPHPVQLADMAPPEAAQEGAQGGGRLDLAVENTGRPTGSQRIGVVDAISSRQRGSDQRQHLVPRVRQAPARRQGQGDGRRVPAGQGAGRGWPAAAARHWPPGRGRRRRF